MCIETVVKNISLDSSSIKIPVPICGRGRLFALHVVQREGDLDGFTVDAFSAEQACQPNFYSHLESEEEQEYFLGRDQSLPVSPTPDEPSDYEADFSPDLYKIIARQTAASLADEAVYRDTSGMPYTNHANGVRNRTEFIYVEITPTTPEEAKVFDLRVVYEPMDIA